MYNGSHVSPRKKSGRSRRPLLLLASLVLLLALAVGGTVAWLNSSSGPVTNTMIPGQVPITINEKFENGTKSDVSVTNNGNIDAYIRTRKGAGDDYGRVSRQQDYIMAVAKKIKAMGTTEAVTSMYGTITQYAKTNLSLEQCLSLASFVKDFNLDNLTKYTVMGKGFKTSAGASVLAVDEEELRTYMLEYFYDQQS